MGASGGPRIVSGDGSLKLLLDPKDEICNGGNDVMTDLSGNLDLDTSNYVWTNSGNIDISSFTGTNVRLAFKYTSTSSASTTWEIDNIKILKN